MIAQAVDLRTVALALAAAAAWGANLALVLSGGPLLLSLPFGAFASVAMLIVLHEAAHGSAARSRILNGLVGRLAMPFVSPYCSFPTFRFLHGQHHGNTNDGAETDPDHFVTDAPTWQLPLRWIFFDVGYLNFYLRRLRARPLGEVLESTACALVFDALVVWVLVSGAGSELLLAWLLPQRLAFLAIGWGFAWLPHHGLEGVEAGEEARKTRARIGMEWLLTPLFFAQNYHLLHHLHPRIPFHRYVRVWREREEQILARDPVLVTVTGQALSGVDYLERYAAIERASSASRGTPISS